MHSIGNASSDMFPPKNEKFEEQRTPPGYSLDVTHSNHHTNYPLYRPVTSIFT